MKNILLINGHPDKESFCYQLAASYQKGAEQSGAKFKILNLADLKFDPILHFGYRKRTELEPDLIEAQKLILEADHLVFVYPTWWGTFPALLKGFIDRVFLPKYAFSFQENSPFPLKLLKGKSARLLVTMDTPLWYNWLIYHNAGHNAMKKATLKFCGVKPVKISAFGPIKSATKSKLAKWSQQVEDLGRNQK